MKNSFVVNVFNHLHAIPEKSGFEYKTSKFVNDALEKMNLDVKTNFAGTAVLAVMDSGKPGPFLALRADMDALEFVIDGDKKFIHACGHDANTSMVLAAAKEISEKGIRKGKVMFLFQPAEETGSGAELVCDSGMLGNVTEMVGIHFRSVEDLLLGQGTPALTHSATGGMEFRIKGQPAHGSRPHLGINAVEAAVLAINAINAVRVDSRVPYSAKVTNIQTEGTATNIIPEYSTFKIDIRAKENQVMQDLIDKIKQAVMFSVKALGAKAEMTKCSWRPAAEYDNDMIETAKHAIIKVLGESCPPIMTPGGEDFHFYRHKLGIKTSYIGLGADLKPGLHKPEMTFDLKALKLGRDILVEVVNQKLGIQGM